MDIEIRAGYYLNSFPQYCPLQIFNGRFYDEDHDDVRNIKEHAEIIEKIDLAIADPVSDIEASC